MLWAKEFCKLGGLGGNVGPHVVACMLHFATGFQLLLFFWCLSPCTPGYMHQIRTLMISTTGPETLLLWTHRVCSLQQFAVLSGNDTVECRACPEGGDCTGATLALVLQDVPGPANLVVQQSNIVALPGWVGSTRQSCVCARSAGAGCGH